MGYVTESVEKIVELKKQSLDADVLVHPECKGAVAKQTDKVASTAGLLKRAIKSPKKALSSLQKVVFCTKYVSNVQNTTLSLFHRKKALILAIDEEVAKDAGDFGKVRIIIRQFP